MHTAGGVERERESPTFLILLEGKGGQRKTGSFNVLILTFGSPCSALRVETEQRNQICAGSCVWRGMPRNSIICIRHLFRKAAAPSCTLYARAVGCVASFLQVSVCLGYHSQHCFLLAFMTCEALNPASKNRIFPALLCYTARHSTHTISQPFSLCS